MPYREQIDKSRIPAHVAIIMDGNEDGLNNVDRRAASDIKPVQKLYTS